jgi:hypothetical protein
MSEQPARPRIHPLAFIGAIVFAAILLGLGYLYLSLGLGQTPTAQTTLTPLAVTILLAPTETPVTIVPTSIFTPTPSPELGPLPGIMGIGAYAKVSNTGGAGLRIRQSATTDSLTQFIAMDEEVFKIIGGPVDKNGFTWWQLEANYDKNRTGWAAEEYLTVIILLTPTP